MSSIWELKIWIVREVAVVFIMFIFMFPAHRISEIFWNWVRSGSLATKIRKTEKVELLVVVGIILTLILSALAFVIVLLLTGN